MSLDNLTPSEFSKWYLLGQSVRRMMGKGEATMYSYNGVVLPKLPEWDKEAYPYAVIMDRSMSSNGSFQFVACTTPFAFDGEYTMGTTDETQPAVISKLLDTGGWGEFTQITVSRSKYTYPSIWSNHNLVHPDDMDSVELYASEPIPIYE